MIGSHYCLLTSGERAQRVTLLHRRSGPAALWWGRVDTVPASCRSRSARTIFDSLLFCGVVFVALLV